MLRAPRTPEVLRRAHTKEHRRRPSHAPCRTVRGAIEWDASSGSVFGQVPDSISGSSTKTVPGAQRITRCSTVGANGLVACYRDACPTNQSALTPALRDSHRPIHVMRRLRPHLPARRSESHHATTLSEGRPQRGKNPAPTAPHGAQPFSAHGSGAFGEEHAAHDERKEQYMASARK